MKCPKCQKETFKVNVAWEHRVKSLPGFVPVRVTCECGYNLKAYLVHKDMKEVLGRLKALQEAQLLLMKAIRLAKLGPEKKFRWPWQKRSETL